MEPTTKTINRVLADIENAERAPDHPRLLAKAAIAKWRSDADRGRLPLCNERDDKGASVLDIDRVLERANAAHDARLGRK